MYSLQPSILRQIQRKHGFKVLDACMHITSVLELLGPTHSWLIYIYDMGDQELYACMPSGLKVYSYKAFLDYGDANEATRNQKV